MFNPSGSLPLSITSTDEVMETKIISCHRCLLYNELATLSLILHMFSPWKFSSRLENCLSSWKPFSSFVFLEIHLEISGLTLSAVRLMEMRNMSAGLTQPTHDADQNLLPLAASWRHCLQSLSCSAPSRVAIENFPLALGKSSHPYTRSGVFFRFLSDEKEEF